MRKPVQHPQAGGRVSGHVGELSDPPRNRSQPRVPDGGPRRGVQYPVAGVWDVCSGTGQAPRTPCAGPAHGSGQPPSPSPSCSQLGPSESNHRQQSLFPGASPAGQLLARVGRAPQNPALAPHPTPPGHGMEEVGTATPARMPGSTPRAHSCAGAVGRRPPTLFPENRTAHPAAQAPSSGPRRTTGPNGGRTCARSSALRPRVLTSVTGTAAKRPGGREAAGRGGVVGREDKVQGGRLPTPSGDFSSGDPNSEMGLEPLWPSQPLLLGLRERGRLGVTSVTLA